MIKNPLQIVPKITNLPTQHSFPLIWEIRIHLATIILLSILSIVCVYSGLSSGIPIAILGSVPAMLYAYHAWFKMEEILKKLP